MEGAKCSSGSDGDEAPAQPMTAATSDTKIIILLMGCAVELVGEFIVALEAFILCVGRNWNNDRRDMVSFFLGWTAFDKLQ